MNNTSDNKTIVLDFYRRVIGQRQLHVAADFISDNYIQHSPMVPPGKQGLLASLQQLKSMPAPPPDAPSPIRHVIAEGDFVALHMNVTLGTRKMAVIDLFKLNGGKFVEHWDAMQPHPDASSHTSADRQTLHDNITITADSKQLVQQCYQQVFIAGDVRQLPQYVSNDFIHHTHDIASGRQGLHDYVLAGQAAVQHMHRVVAERNIVLVQASGKIHQQAFVFYDLFRVDANVICEHWRVAQAVPVNLPPGFSMI